MKIIRYSPLVHLIFAAFIPFLPLKAAQSVSLRLDQPTKTERGSLPISGGLPFSKGALGKTEDLRLLDSTGKELPLQARTLSKWPDGSVKSALIDFQDNIPIDKDSSVTLEYGAGVKSMPRSDGIKIQQDATHIAVDTGAIQFSILKSGCGWMEEVSMNGKIVGKGINFARFKGDSAPNKATVNQMTIEEGGDIPHPLRIIIKVEGTYEGHLKTPFILRIHAYAGKPFVRVFHTFVYAGDRHKTDDLMVELEIGFELAGGIKKILYGINGEMPLEPKPANGAALLYSKSDIEFDVTGIPSPPLPTDKPLGWWMETKGKPAGWMSLFNDSGAVQMGVRDMWQNYPKGLRVEGNKATLALWPRENSPFDLRTNARFLEAKKGSFQWNDSSTELEAGHVSGTHSGDGKGSAKTHELYFHFQTDPSPEKLNAAFASFQEPTYLFASPKWYADTRIFDVFNPAGMEYQDANLKRWDDVLELSARWILFMPKYWRWYGMWDYGDFIFCGPTIPDPKHPEPRFPIGPRPPLEHGRFDVDAKFKTNWAANCHYDIIQALLLHYMRTGKREYFRQAEISALNTNDVSGYHPFENKKTAQETEAAENTTDPEEEHEGRDLYGFISRHGCGHGQISASHAFIQFRTPLYLLTGNERVKDLMHMAFESASLKGPEIFTYGSVRPCSAITRVFETWWSISGDQKSEEATKFILDYWLSRQQTQDDRGSYVGINKTYGRNKDGSNEIFDPYHVLPKDKHEVTDPNTWESGKTHGWRLMNFGATEAMMDWYNITGDDRIGQSVVRFMRATKIHDTHYRWYKAQQHLAFSWRLTKDEAFREWLRTDLEWAWPRYGLLNQAETLITLNDHMTWEDFNREFAKFKSKDWFSFMHVEDCSARILLNPSAMYTFDPYDKAFPSAPSTKTTTKSQKTPSDKPEKQEPPRK